MAIIDADINLSKANLLMEDRLNGSGFRQGYRRLGNPPDATCIFS
jgi:hypothetical protein